MLPGQDSLQERRRSNQEDGSSSDRGSQSQDHHESEDEDTARSEAPLQDDHVNDEIFVPQSEFFGDEINPPHLGESSEASRSNSIFVQGVSGRNNVMLISSGNRIEDNQQHGADRMSPVPIDLIDIDLDPATSAHDSENQGDHDADGDQLPASPNLRNSMSSYDRNRSHELYRRGASHQHEHFEVQLGDAMNVVYSQSSMSRNFSVTETTEHLRTVSVSNASALNNDQSEERQDAPSGSNAPVTSSNEARDSQHQYHGYSEDRYTTSTSPDADQQRGEIFESIRQNTPPAERSAEFGDAELTTSDHEEFDVQSNNVNDISSIQNSFERPASVVISRSNGDSAVFACSSSGSETAANGERHGNRSSVVEGPTEPNVSEHGALGVSLQQQQRVDLLSTWEGTSNAEWDLQNFSRTFYMQAEKDDKLLHRDRPFNYCKSSRRARRHQPGMSNGSDPNHAGLNGHLQDFEISVSAAEESESQASSSTQTDHEVDDSCVLYDLALVEFNLQNQMNCSACGPTAVTHVLKIMGYNVQYYYAARRINCRQRDNLAPLPEYLISRSVAGSNHEDLIRGIENITRGDVSGRFFSFYPERDVCLRHWLLYWMRKGCVPVLTLNYQKRHPEASDKNPISDSWHYQTVVGVEGSKVHLSNPEETVHVANLGYYLCSDSKLLVRWQDAWSRYDEDSNLKVLAQHPNQDPRWTDYNVLGQVCSLLRMKKRIDSFAKMTSHSSNQQSPNQNNSDINRYNNNPMPANHLSTNGTVMANQRRRHVGSAGDDDDNEEDDQRVFQANGFDDSPLARQNSQGMGNGFGGGGDSVSSSGGGASSEQMEVLRWQSSLLSSHITIPAIVKAGIIMFCRKTTGSVFQQLTECEELKVSDNPS